MDSSKPQSDQQMKSESPSDTKNVGEIYDLDEAVLRAQGREAQLGRSFSWFGALGLAFRCVRRFPKKMTQKLIGLPPKYCQLLVDVCFLLWCGIQLWGRSSGCLQPYILSSHSMDYAAGSI